MRHATAFTYTLWHEITASATEPLPLAKRTHQVTRMLQGLASIEQAAVPTTEDWRLCSDAVNLVETLVVELQVAEDTQGLLDDAIAALAAAGRRHQGGMPIRLDGPGIRAVRGVLADYADLLGVLPARIVIRAHRLTERRIAAILAGKRRPHDVEVMDL